MALFVVKLFVRAAVGDLPTCDHYMAMLVNADDDVAARTAASNVDLLASLIVPGGRDVHISEMRIYGSDRVSATGSVVLALRDAACLICRRGRQRRW